MTTAEKIAALRHQRGLTQADFCREWNKKWPAMPITRAALAKWETGEKTLKLPYFASMVRFLKVTADELLFDSQVPARLQARGRKKSVT